MFLVKPKQSEPVAAIKGGTYRARVSNIKSFTNNYGQRVGFEFTVLGGEHDGHKVLRSTAPQLTRQSKLAEVIEGIVGRPLEAKELAEGFDLSGLVGKECSILVLQQRSRAGAVYSNVEKVFCT